MEYYWKSDDLTFSSSGKTTRSWKATLERYKQTLSNESRHGHDDVQESGNHAAGRQRPALVLGEWQLPPRQRRNDGGRFTLVLRQGSTTSG